MKPDTLCWQFFGPFELCAAQRVLLRDGIPVPLTPRTFETLVVLVQSAPALVTSEALMSAVWKGIEVEPANLAQQVYFLRKALDDTPRDRKYKYIENVSGSGYRFICRVEARWVSAPPSVGDELERNPGWLRKYRWPVLSAALAAIALTVVLAFALRPLDVRILSYIQLTNDGRQKLGPLITDGRRIFFRELEGEDRIMMISASGGPATPLLGIPPESSPASLSRDGKKLLLIKRTAAGPVLLSYNLAAGKIESIAEPWSGTWSPDGKMLALEGDGVLRIGRPESPFMYVKTQGKVRQPQWSPDGQRIRFSIVENGVPRLAEVQSDGAGLRDLTELNEIASVPTDGVWTPDGRYFLFDAGPLLKRNIWFSREGGRFSWLRKNKPQLLTNGPGSWRSPSPAGNSPVLFALHEVARAELAFFDFASRKWRSYWHGDSAYELDFSRDGGRVAFVSYPENTLWTASPDGSARIQLTNREMEVHQPHWSPDGKRIAFMGHKQGEPWRIYVINGALAGHADAVLPAPLDQGVPTWSRDGRSLVFGDRLDTKPGGYMNVHRIDLESKKLEDIANSHGMWSPRISPDGNYLLAVSSDSKSLYLSRIGATEWRLLLRQWFVDNATWSADSHYIYYNGKIDVAGMGFFRLAITLGSAPEKPEKLADLTDFSWAPDNWFGVTPDGIPLALRDASAQEIFALDYTMK